MKGIGGMGRIRYTRVLGLLLVGILLFGTLSGGSYAASDTISETGPNSNNTISHTIDATCTVLNSNNLAISTSNKQKASTGDVSLDSVTTAGSGWGEWDPALWKAKGYTYAQWKAAVNAQIASLENSWENMTPGGAIRSGDAQNVSTIGFGISLQNSDGGSNCGSSHSSPGDSGSVDTT